MPKGRSRVLDKRPCDAARASGCCSGCVYRRAVEDALIRDWIGVAKGEPKKELNALMANAAREALDPRVSSEARALLYRWPPWGRWFLGVLRWRWQRFVDRYWRGVRVPF